jgi:molybdenum cofactor cytidylyltransferase
MPLVDQGVIERLIAAFNPAEHRSICVPVHQGMRGNPVLWGRQHFEALKQLKGDQGARVLFDQYTDELVEVAMPDAAVLTDIDTPEALDDFRSGRLP